MQIALNSATVSSAAPAMSPDDTKKLSEQLKNMSKEEKRRWAMQNAKNFMPATGVHVNKDMDNQPVNDAVKSVTDQQAKDLQNFNALNELRSKLLAIEKNDQPQKDEALKKFQAVTGTTYDPSSSFVYATGEMGEVQAAKFDRAVGEYRKTVLPLFNSELKEKLNCVLQLEQNLLSTYTPIEEAIALTKYGDDAQETSNKMHLMMGHMNVLQKVRTSIETYNEILTQYADRYAAVMKVTPVKEQNEKKE
jgi:hypothetical protein